VSGCIHASLTGCATLLELRSSCLHFQTVNLFFCFYSDLFIPKIGRKVLIGHDFKYFNSLFSVGKMFPEIDPS
jgi:hypothetical protein